MLEVDRQIKQPLGESDVEGCDVDSLADEDLELRTPKYVFSERARLVENSTVLTQRTLVEDKLLA